VLAIAVATILALALLASLGCSSELFGIRFSLTRGTVVPQAPVVSPEHDELHRELADLSAKVLHRVEDIGAPAGSGLVGQAAQGADAVAAHAGPPAKPIMLPAPGIWTAMSEADKAVSEHVKAQVRADEERRHYEEALRALAQKPQTTTVDLGARSPLLRNLLIYGGLGFVFVLVLRAFLQVVTGIELVKDGAPAGSVAPTLAAKQSWFTKVLVGVAKWVLRV
jgi:hypothetical protein